MALWMVNLSYFTLINDNPTCNWWWAPLCGTLQSKLVKLDSGDSATVPLYGKSLCQVRGICNQGTADGRLHTLAVGERVPHTLDLVGKQGPVGSGDSHQCLTAGKRWSCKKRVHHSSHLRHCTLQFRFGHLNLEAGAGLVMARSATSEVNQLQEFVNMRRSTLRTCHIRPAGDRPVWPMHRSPSCQA